MTLELMLERHRGRLRRLSDRRLHLPAQEPYMEGHNTWCVNVPGSLLVIPVADVAQHTIAGLCFLLQNGYVVYDDVNDRRIPGIEEFAGLANLSEPLPLTFVDQYMLAEAVAELATACYAGVLMLQGMGLGGWMFDGIDRFTMLGASGDPEVPGLGFRYDLEAGWSTPNPTGLEGVFEAFCPPHHPTWRPRWRRSRSASSGPAAPTTATPPAPGPTAPGCGAAPRSTRPSSRPASASRPSTCSTPSAGSRRRSRR